MNRFQRIVALIFTCSFLTVCGQAEEFVIRDLNNYDQLHLNSRC